MFKHWVNIMCLASEQDERGSLPTASDIAFALRLKPCEAKKIIGALIAEKLIDESDEGHLSVHGWDNRQQESDNVATRVKEYRGMASREAQEDFMGGMPEWKTAEGVSTEVEFREDEEAVIADIIGGLRSGLTYGGSQTIRELQRKLNFMTVSQASRIESLPHKTLKNQS